MNRFIVLLFAIAAYLLFFTVFLYLVAFTGDLPWVPVTVDRGPASPLAVALIVDTVLIALFGLQHSVMARPGFKRRWTRIIGTVGERSAYVVASSLILIVLFAGWRPVPGELWHITAPWAEWTMWGLFGAGWLVVLVSTFLISHFELFGLTQAWSHMRGREPAALGFHTPLFYKAVRHPLYLGFLIAFWATPVMSWSHLLLAVGMTVYVLIAIGHEERDLVAMFGDQYLDYKRHVGMLIPGLGKAAK